MKEKSISNSLIIHNRQIRHMGGRMKPELEPMKWDLFSGHEDPWHSVNVMYLLHHLLGWEELQPLQQVFGVHARNEAVPSKTAHLRRVPFVRIKHG